jgi:hypothetical protein
MLLQNVTKKEAIQLMKLAIAEDNRKCVGRKTYITTLSQKSSLQAMALLQAKIH